MLNYFLLAFRLGSIEFFLFVFPHFLQSETFLIHVEVHLGHFQRVGFGLLEQDLLHRFLIHRRFLLQPSFGLHRAALGRLHLLLRLTLTRLLIAILIGLDNIDRVGHEIFLLYNFGFKILTVVFNLPIMEKLLRIHGLLHHRQGEPS